MWNYLRLELVIFELLDMFCGDFKHLFGFCNFLFGLWTQCGGFGGE